MVMMKWMTIVLTTIHVQLMPSFQDCTGLLTISHIHAKHLYCIPNYSYTCVSSCDMCNSFPPLPCGGFNIMPWTSHHLCMPCQTMIEYDIIEGNGEKLSTEWTVTVSGAIVASITNPCQRHCGIASLRWWRTKCGDTMEAGWCLGSDT